MRTLLLALVLTGLIPARAQDKSPCPGQNTIEMWNCALQKRERSNRALKEKLNADTFRTWNRTTQQVCATAYAPYRQGSIYQQMVIGCDDRLNRVLLEELKGLGEF